MPSHVQLSREGFQACAWLVSQDCRIWKIWWWVDIVLQFSPAAAADNENEGPPPLPAHIFLSFLPPGPGIDCDEVPTSLTVCPLIDDRCPLEPNRAPRTTVITPARGPTIPASFTAPPNPTRRGEISSKLFPLLSDAISRILLSVLASHFDFCFAGDLNNA